MILYICSVKFDLFMDWFIGVVIVLLFVFFFIGDQKKNK